MALSLRPSNESWNTACDRLDLSLHAVVAVWRCLYVLQTRAGIPHATDWICRCMLLWQYGAVCTSFKRELEYRMRPTGSVVACCSGSMALSVRPSNESWNTACDRLDLSLHAVLAVWRY